MRDGADADAEFLRRNRSARPLSREVLLLAAGVVTLGLNHFQLTSYSAPLMTGLGLGLLIGAIVTYAIRMSRR